MSQQQPATGQQESQLQNTSQPQGGQGAIFPTRNYLPHDAREESIGTLNQVLADAVVLQSQCKSAHWNVKGLHFYQLHELFADVAEMLDDYIDEVAERVAALGGLARGTVPAAAQATNLPRFPVEATDEWTVLESLATSLASFDATLGMGIETASSRQDLDTADLLNELSRNVSKSLWFVEAHLQGAQQGQQGMQAAQGVSQQPGQQARQPIGQQAQRFGQQAQQPPSQEFQGQQGSQQFAQEPGQQGGQQPIAAVASQGQSGGRSQQF